MGTVLMLVVALAQVLTVLPVVAAWLAIAVVVAVPVCWVLQRRAQQTAPRGDPVNTSDTPEDCTETASCSEGDHTYTWPCDLAPGTGRLATDTTEEARRG